MPQMAPLSWLALFIFFTLVFFLFNSMNFFMTNYSTKTKKFMKSKIPFNWKW